MKLLIALLVDIATAATLFAVEPQQLPLVRAGGGYTFLASPSLNDIADLPGSSVTRGGGSFGAQLLLGSLFQGVFFYGVEASYLRMYDYSVTGASTVQFNTVPLLALAHIALKAEDVGFIPFLQAGAGVGFTTVTTAVTNKPKATSTQSDFALMAGAGVARKIAPNFSLDFLVRYYHLFTDSTATGGVNLSINASFRLGHLY